MKIVILDKYSLGEDTPLDALEKFGEVVCYDSSDEDEAIERTRNADVIILNKVKITRNFTDLEENIRNWKLLMVNQ